MATESPHIELGPCPECQLGTLRPSRAFYCRQVGGMLISVPDFPAWICDLCGRREYDEASVQELAALLQVERGQRPQRRRSARAGQPARALARATTSNKHG